MKVFDRVGKGTQIAKLKRYLEEKGQLVHVIHYSNIKGDDIRNRSEQYYHQMFDTIKFATLNNLTLILDRAHGGETVYSPVYRGYEGDYVYYLEQRFGKRILDNVTMFVFTDEAENLIERDDGLSFSTDLEKKKDEIKRFVEFFQRSNIENKFLVNINGRDENVIWDFIKSVIEHGDENDI